MHIATFRNHLQKGLWGLLTILAGFVLLTKPIHIDDTVVLHIAQKILQDPLRPFDGDLFWLAEPQPLFKTTTNPPLVSYWLAPAIAIGGYREWWLHLWLMPFVGLLGWGVYRLARLCLSTMQARWATAWVLVSPAVLPGMNLMRDVPALALFIAGMACWMEGVQLRQSGWLAIGALLGGLAGFTKYAALFWIGLAQLFALQQRAWRQTAWLILALLPVGLWSLHNLWVYGEPHLVYLWQERRGSVPWEAKWLPAVVGLGASTLLGLGLVVGRSVPAWQKGLLIALVIGFVGGHRHLYADQSLHLQAILWLAVGGINIGLALLTAKRQLLSVPNESETVGVSKRFRVAWQGMEANRGGRWQY